MEHILALAFLWRPAANHIPQLLVLLSQLSDELVLRVLVDARCVLDALGTVGIAQSGQRLFVVGRCRRDRTDHDGLARTAQGVLQQPRQLRVTVRDDCIGLRLAHGLVRQLLDHIAEGRQ